MTNQPNKGRARAGAPALAASIVAALGLSVMTLGASPAAASPYGEALEVCRMELEKDYSSEAYRLRMAKAKKSGRLRTLTIQLRARDGGEDMEAACVVRSGELVSLDVKPA